MRHRPLGRTGLFVSEMCLGTMTFGGGAGLWEKIGAVQQAEADALVGQALDAGINFIDTADIYSAGLSEQHHRPGAAQPEGAARQRGAGDQGLRRDGRGCQRARRLAGAHPGRRARQPEAAADRPHRPLPDPRLRPGHADRGDAARAGPAGAQRRGALRRRVELGRLAGGQGARHQRAAGPGAHRIAAGLLHAGRARPRARDRCRCWPAKASA